MTAAPGEPAPTAAAYDALPYPSFPFSVTHPDRLNVLARLCGLAAAPVERCRVLELGSAGGGNLLPMALELPGATFVGVDLSRRQVEDGRALVSRLGVTNLDLRHASILDIDDAWGEFDYVLCHGVYSWVPDVVQRKILEVSRRNLAPRGVAYVSYNVLPGWRMRGMIRDMMRYHARQFAEPRVAVAQARRLLEYLAKNVNVATPFGLLLRQEAQGLDQQSDAYLFHEHLEDHNEPLFFHQFAERAAAAGLKVLGEAGPGETEVTLSPRAPAGHERGSKIAIETEQYRDFVRNRLFRATLLVREEAPLGGDARWQDVSALLVSAQLDVHEMPEEDRARIPVPPPEAPRFDPKATGEPDLEPEKPVARKALAVFETRHNRLLHAYTPLLAAAARELHARWPQAVPFDDLLAAARAQLGQGGPAPEADRESLGRDVLDAFAQDVIELRPRRLALVTEVSARPVASPLARYQVEVEGSTYPTNQRHEAMSIDRFEAQLLRRLDGTNDAAALAAAMVEATLRGDLEVKRDGAALADRVELLRLFTEAVPVKLGILCRKSFLIG